MLNNCADKRSAIIHLLIKKFGKNDKIEIFKKDFNSMPSEGGIAIEESKDKIILHGFYTDKELDAFNGSKDESEEEDDDENCDFCDDLKLQEAKNLLTEATVLLKSIINK